MRSGILADMLADDNVDVALGRMQGYRSLCTMGARSHDGQNIAKTVIATKLYDGVYRHETTFRVCNHRHGARLHDGNNHHH